MGDSQTQTAIFIPVDRSKDVGKKVPSMVLRVVGNRVTGPKFEAHWMPLCQGRHVSGRKARMRIATTVKF